MRKGLRTNNGDLEISLPEAIPILNSVNDDTKDCPVATVFANIEPSRKGRDTGCDQAYTIPALLDNMKQEDHDRNLLALAQKRGQEAVEEEKIVAQISNHLGLSQNVAADRILQVGNKIAQFRDQMGLSDQAEHENDRQFVATDVSKQITPQTHFPGSYGNGGYVISDYETVDYVGSQDYNISEYKSVYDS
jgi:hypothetical protein